MAIQRTAWIDDDGSGTVGTIINNAEKSLLYNQIDALAYTLLQRSDTGTVNNWAPGLIGHTFIEWTGAADLTITGLAGGVIGQHVVINHIGAAGAVVYCAHQHPSSTQKLFNSATSASTPIGYRGSAQYLFDGGSWILVAHEQGTPVTPPFSAADFTGSGSMVWTVEGADVGEYRYRLSGRMLTVNLGLNATSISGTPTGIIGVQLPFVSARNVNGGFGRLYDNSGTVSTLAAWTGQPGNRVINLSRNDGAALSVNTNNTYVFAQFVVEVS